MKRLISFLIFVFIVMTLIASLASCDEPVQLEKKSECELNMEVWQKGNKTLDSLAYLMTIKPNPDFDTQLRLYYKVANERNAAITYVEKNCPR